MIDLTPFFQAIIALLAALITYKVIPWLKEKMTESQYKQLCTVVDIAVYAAEQLYGNGHGAEKLKYAMDVLESQGFKVDENLVRAAIEKAVYKQTPKIKDLTLSTQIDIETDEESE